MISSLKHYTARFWVTIVAGWVASFFILPVLQPHLNLKWTILPVLGIFAVLFFAAGWGFNRLAIGSIERHVREATTWERDGLHFEAETAFKKAVAVFDAFLLSPPLRKKYSSKLASRLARYYLARTERSLEAEQLIISYLESHPEDTEAAEHWLHRLPASGKRSSQEMELVSRIASAQLNNEDIQYRIAKLYIAEERIDFQAIQTYGRIVNNKQPLEEETAAALAALFLREGRADELALSVYMKAYRSGAGRAEILKGIAACVHNTEDVPMAVSLTREAAELLEGIDGDRLQKMRERFNLPIPQPDENEQISARGFQPVFDRFASGLKELPYRFAAALVGHGATRLKKILRSIDPLKRSQKVLMRAALALLIAAVVVLILSTLKHLIETEPVQTDRVSLPAPASVTDQYTIQVAAYLKPDHAERYVKALQKQGLDVFLSKAGDGDKKWYQVRVSHFPDKASAKAYGESLKIKGVIEDFYITTYGVTPQGP